jgi:hypothetical protein
MDESIQKAVLRCVFRVFAISENPMGYAEDSYDMAFAKLPERGSSATLGGCYQLLLAPRPKIVNRRGIVPCRAVNRCRGAKSRGLQFWFSGERRDEGAAASSAAEALPATAGDS